MGRALLMKNEPDAALTEIHKESRKAYRLFGLIMASGVSLIKKMVTLLAGYVCVTLIQVWGVVWESLKMLAFNFGPEAHQVVIDAGISEELIGLCYQLGVLIFPPLVPVILWVLANWTLIEQFTGWKKPPA